MDETKIEPMFPSVTVELSRQDGNIFVVIGTVTRAMKQAKIPAAVRNAFTEAVFASESYEEALQQCMKWVNVA
jgi:TolB-like protein